MKLWLLVLFSGGLLAGAARPEQSDHNWQLHQQLSELMLQQDRQLLQHELQQAGLLQPLPAVYDKGFGRTTPLMPHQLAPEEAQRIAINILSFQTPSGGWSKRTNSWSAPRLKGQWFGVEPDYIPTFDNNATTVELSWLAAFYPSADRQLEPQIRQAVHKAIRFILQAQYPNGGFAQTYPLRGGYHDAITLNDDVMANLLTLLHQVATDPLFAFVDPPIKQQAAKQFELGVQLLLKTQLIVQGQLTIWASQYDPVKLVPIKARAYELPALISSESAAVTLLLMQRVKPSAEVIKSVEAAVHWFQEKQINNSRMVRTEQGVQWLQQQGAPGLWARFYDLKWQQALFVDRDGRVVRSMAELSIERQLGYGWYQSNAEAVLKQYPKWKARLDVVQEQ